ncbi:MAG: 2-phospho-L-lactate transferase [Hadesarchaea archaeon]|nr:2-phospho-L-lactate transferase [Hadesarchaea archaeon]
MLTILSGGTGTPKLIQGLNQVLPQQELNIIVNTAEDVEVSGLRVSPDLDTVTYTLADMIDEEKWYGIENDTFHVHETLEELGRKEILKIGDRDRAIKLYRTLKMKEGAELSEVTNDISRELGVQAKIMPMTNDQVTTEIITENGSMSFHEFWVEKNAENEVKEVNFINSENASPAPGVIKAIDESSGVVIGPSNPVTSINPILSIEEIRVALERNKEKVLSISPVLGEAPVSGPTDVLMRGLGYEVNPFSVAEMYKDFVSEFMIHESDEKWVEKISDLGIRVTIRNILMNSNTEKRKLAQEMLEQLDY